MKQRRCREAREVDGMVGIRAQRKAERPGEILEAAFEEFVLHGYAATRLEDVAARAGVTKGTIYVYFASKEQLFETVVHEVSKDPIAELENAEAAWTGDLRHDIDAFLRRLYRFMAENPRSREILRLLIAEANRFPALVDSHFGVCMGPVIERLRGRLVDAIAAGEMPETSVSELPEVVLGPMLALNVMMLLFANRSPLDPDSFVATHRAVLLDGLLAGMPDARAGQPDDGFARGWSAWTAFPNPQRGQSLTAPLGPGLYELRLSTGEALLVGTGHSVVGRMTTLVPPEIAPEQRKSLSRRRFLQTHLDALQYRTRATETYASAIAIADAVDLRGYRFGRLR